MTEFTMKINVGNMEAFDIHSYVSIPSYNGLAQCPGDKPMHVPMVTQFVGTRDKKLQDTDMIIVTLYYNALSANYLQ